MIYDKIVSEYQHYESQIQRIEKQLESLPKGKLICSKDHNHYKWYCSDGHSKTYIPKKDRSVAEQLAKRKYLTALLSDIKKEYAAFGAYLRHHSNNSSKTELLLNSNPEFLSLLAPSFSPASENLKEWAETPYERNSSHPEHLIYKTNSGYYVRSKSEALIDTLLSFHQIPYRYENPLQLGKQILYPDFTLRHPKNGAYYYWEHFGLMDNPEYAQNAARKLQLYISNGIYPNINLIITSETSEYPLDTETISDFINHFFL